AVLVTTVLVGGVVATGALSGRPPSEAVGTGSADERAEPARAARPPSESLSGTSPSPRETPSHSASPSPSASASPTATPEAGPQTAQPLQNHHGVLPACRVHWTVSSDWGDGFVAQITLDSQDVLGNWALSFVFPGDQRISRGWNAQFVQQDQAVVATGTGGDHEVSLGLTASYHGANKTPSGFALDGTSCAAG
ncbi:MAG: cellulose binding domain-containing protein, partial [Actinocatenispora sp.]